MDLDRQIRSACTEEFEELCALFSASALDSAELTRLQQHVTVCDPCRTVLAEYHCVASDSMAKIASKHSVGDEERDAAHLWADAAAEHRAKDLLLKNLKTTEAKATIVKAAPRSRAIALRLLPIAAVLAMGLSVGYLAGVKHKKSPIGSGTLTAQNNVRTANAELQDLLTQRDAQNVQLSTTSQTITQLKSRADADEKALNEMITLKASLEQNLKDVSAADRQKAQSLDSISTQRDGLQHKLDDATQSLQNVRGELKNLQEERQKGLLRTASLETRIDQLSTELQDSKASVRREDDSLASDRDIRELIGARQLYIADVFDVDQNGQKRKPFGRVFYTKGKSLIFYAFDLDQQPNVRKAKAFQVWGSPTEDQSHAVSLGLFYMDSEANRRWVFKSEDPAVLSQINSVFVTMEPKGESKSPSGKPILYAYLRTAPPNHP